MEMYQGSSTQQPAAICALKSPADAIHILEAVRLGLVPRVTRRLTGHERAMIRPGTVWVWEEEETNMRRWTDGRRWGASRVGGGGFLVYTESSDTHSPPPSHPSPHMGYYPGPSSSRRPESLIKQTYSTTMTHPVTGKVKKFHVVAYSSKHNPQGDALNPFPLPYQLPTLSTLKVTPGIWPEWEHRREPEPPVRRATQTPFASSTHSTPVTAISSPNASQFPSHVPPTAFPRPPSPRRDMFARPYPPQMSKGHYDPRVDPMIPRSTSGPYTSPYQNAERMPGMDASPVPYGGRHGSLPPPSYPPQPSYGGERYHPYAAPRPGSGRISYPPSSSASATSTPTMGPIAPMTPDTSMNLDRVRTSPSITYSTYQRPGSSASESTQKPRIYSDGSVAQPQYPQVQAYDRTTPESKEKILEHTDPRRYPSADPNMGAHARHMSASSRFNQLGAISTNSNQPMSQLVPPGHSTPTGRSPKMSIAAALLNQDGTSQGASLTLPPLRGTMDERDRSGPMPMLPSPGHISPRILPEVSSPTDSVKVKGGEVAKGWGEDARQLGELGKRVVL